jgi:hypothetical protein
MSQPYRTAGRGLTANWGSPPGKTAPPAAAPAPASGPGGATAREALVGGGERGIRWLGLQVGRGPRGAQRACETGRAAAAAAAARPWPCGAGPPRAGPAARRGPEREGLCRAAARVPSKFWRPTLHRWPPRRRCQRGSPGSRAASGGRAPGRRATASARTCCRPSAGAAAATRRSRPGAGLHLQRLCLRHPLRLQRPLQLGTAGAAAAAAAAAAGTAAAAERGPLPPRCACCCAVRRSNDLLHADPCLISLAGSRRLRSSEVAPTSHPHPGHRFQLSRSQRSVASHLQAASKSHIQLNGTPPFACRGRRRRPQRRNSARRPPPAGAARRGRGSAAPPPRTDSSGWRRSL